MGHNGGFNPYRDANGEFATPAGSGKPGRNRKAGSGGGSAAGRAAATKGVNRATAVSQAIPNPGIDYRSRKVTRTPSLDTELAARNQRSSAAYSHGRIGPRAGENEDRAARGLAPLKPARPRTVVRYAKSKLGPNPAPAAPAAKAPASSRSTATKGVNRATALGQGIPNPGFDYRSRTVKRPRSESAEIYAGEVKSSQAATLGRVGPQASENAWRAERGLAPLKPNRPRTQIRPKK